ncbi:MAG: hypothetical protein PHE58_03625, partial [Candidatus Omnitrophica bacterium]|nr:hypothetical protein [Candidatus Omnitrophota bacterium]
MFTNYICALDIGSSKISAAVGEVKRNKIISLYLENNQSKAVRKGQIVDSVELVGSISKILKTLRARSGINIKFVTIGISGQDLSVKHSHAVIPLSIRGGKAITASDIHKVNEQALILGAHLDDEVINYIPYQYSVDSEENILNPLGLYSHKLGVDLNLVCSKASSVQSLTLAVNQSGYEIKDLVFSGLATSEAVFTKELKNGINILCDVGSDITEVLIFNNGVLRNIEILQTGGDDITRALEEHLKIPFPLAEE